MTKKVAKKAHLTKKVSKKASRSQTESSRRSAARNFPKNTVEDAVKVPLVLKNCNGGEPWSPDEVKNALKVGNNYFFYLVASSQAYGFTTGTNSSSSISLTDLGKRAVYPASVEEERKAKLDAFLTVSLFQKLIERYKTTKLPEMEFLGNTLIKDFSIPKEQHEELVDIFRANAIYLNIENQEISSIDSIPKSSTHVVSRSTSGNSLFVIMPFSEKYDNRPEGFFDEVLKRLIQPAGEGFSIKTAARAGSDIIQATIINDLLDADMVVADITDHNPNVLFELGIRMTTKKPTLIIKSKDTEKIFDIDVIRYCDYDQNLWHSTLEIDIPRLKEAIQETWVTKESQVSYIELFRQTKTI